MTHMYSVNNKEILKRVLKNLWKCSFLEKIPGKISETYREGSSNNVEKKIMYLI